MWNEIAKALGLGIPDEQLQKIAPVLDALWSDTRRALGRDLSAVDPAVIFQASLAAWSSEP